MLFRRFLIGWFYKIRPFFIDGSLKNYCSRVVDFMNVSKQRLILVIIIYGPRIGNVGVCSLVIVNYGARIGDIAVCSLAAPGGSLVEEADVQRAPACLFAAPSDYKSIRAYYEVNYLVSVRHCIRSSTAPSVLDFLWVIVTDQWISLLILSIQCISY